MRSTDPEKFLQIIGATKPHSKSTLSYGVTPYDNITARGVIKMRPSGVGLGRSEIQDTALSEGNDSE